MEQENSGVYKRQKTSSAEKELDCTNAARGVWLVKVPKYISSRWQKAPPLTEAGRLKITRGNGGKNDIKFTLSDDMVNLRDVEKTAIPKEHQFVISNISKQTLGVFSQNSADNGESSVGPSDIIGPSVWKPGQQSAIMLFFHGMEIITLGISPTYKLFLEGHVFQKGECRPLADDRYMQLKRQSILKASQPERQVKQIAKIVQSFKPISDHKHNIEFEQKKKAEGKKSREDKDKVMDMLFNAFEKHQYYNIKDLEKITRQPIPYLKEILKEICNYNAKNPHKSMWELKPEYRHYRDQDGSS